MKVLVHVLLKRFLQNQRKLLQDRIQKAAVKKDVYVAKRSHPRHPLEGDEHTRRSESPNDDADLGTQQAPREAHRQSTCLQIERQRPSQPLARSFSQGSVYNRPNSRTDAGSLWLPDERKTFACFLQ